LLLFVVLCVGWLVEYCVGGGWLVVALWLWHLVVRLVFLTWGFCFRVALFCPFCIIWNNDGRFWPWTRAGAMAETLRDPSLALRTFVSLWCVARC